MAIDPVKAFHLLDIGIRTLTSPKKPKEEMPKEEKKEEPKSEPEKKRSGGYVKAADGCAQRGKTKGRIV